MKNKSVKRMMAFGLGMALILGSMAGCSGGGKGEDTGAGEEQASEKDVPTIRLISWPTPSDP